MRVDVRTTTITIVRHIHRSRQSTQKNEEKNRTEPEHRQKNRTEPEHRLPRPTCAIIDLTSNLPDIIPGTGMY